MLNVTFPKWAIQPKSKDKVIPTNKGWVNEKTGELLVSHKDLDLAILEYQKYFDQLSSLISSVEVIKQDDQVKVNDGTTSTKTDEQEQAKKLAKELASVKKEEEPKKEVVAPKPVAKKRGPKPKIKTTE